MSKKKQTISLLVLSATAGLMYLAPFLRFSFYDQMMSALQITDIQMGTIGSIYGLFYVIAFLPSGFLSEKFDTKALLAISNIAMCLCTVWYAFYPGYKAILVIHALYGIFSVGTFWSPYLKAVRSLASEEKQGTIFGLSEGLRGVAQTIVSFACVGVLSIASSVTLGFRLTLWINAAAYALLAVAVIILLPSSKPEKDSSTSEITQYSVFLKTLPSGSVFLLSWPVTVYGPPQTAISEPTVPEYWESTPISPAFCPSSEATLSYSWPEHPVVLSLINSVPKVRDFLWRSVW